MSEKSNETEASAEVAGNLQVISERMKSARQDNVNNAPALVAVSKRQPDDRIEAALVAGHRVFGENRVQEAQRRWAERRGLYPDLKLHLIGPLQTNKAADAGGKSSGESITGSESPNPTPMNPPLPIGIP